jgi:hypothetical protein
MNKKTHIYKKNLEVHHHNARSTDNYHQLISNLTKSKKELLMQELISHKEVSSNSFYSVEGYFNSGK